MSDKIRVAVGGLPAKTRKTIERMLAQNGAGVSLVKSPAGAGLEFLRQGEVDLAFVGIDALDDTDIRDVQPENGRRRVFVALIGGPDDPRAFAFAEQLKAFDFLISPVSPEDVDAIVAAGQRLCAPVKVLILDPAESIRKIIRKILAAGIYRLEIDEAALETTAVNLCSRTSFDVVFFDCATPDAGSLDVAREIAELSPRTKLVMMSVERNRWQERLGFRRGLAAFLHKPFYPMDIDVILHRLCGMNLSRVAATSGGSLEGFEVRVQGRTVTATHQGSGHGYQFLWFGSPPHLRSALVHEAAPPAEPCELFRLDAERVATMELERAGLLSSPALERLAG